MSLTSLIKNNKEVRGFFPSLKNQLVTLSGSPITKDMWKTPIVVSGVGTPFESTKIGTAFDYVARAILERQVGTENAASRTLICQRGFEIIMELIGESPDCWDIVSGLKGVTILSIPNHWVEGIFPEENPEFPNIQQYTSSSDPNIAAEMAQGLALAQKDCRFLEILVKHWNNAMDTKAKFISGEASIEDYSRSALFLAELDAVFRNRALGVLDYCFRDMQIGEEPYGKTYFSQRTSLSLEEMTANVAELGRNFEQFIKTIKMSHVILNPVFEEYSAAVGGADADVIYDSTLIDFKTTVKLGYDSYSWAQILGYAAMALRLGMELDRAGIYFARYNFVAMLEFTPLLRTLLNEYLATILTEVGRLDLI